MSKHVPQPSRFHHQIAPNMPPIPSLPPSVSIMVTIIAINNIIIIIVTFYRMTLC